MQAGYAILAEEGIKALKIDRLCRRLGVTKGSFYWHFTDIAGYRAALVEAWSELRDEDRSHFGDLAPMPPRERLSQLMMSLLGARHWTLERAMREWARTDEDVAASVRAADQRANATFAAGIGFLHLSGQRPSSRVRAQEAEELRRLPSATMDDLVASNFTELLVPARYGGSQADFLAILDPVRLLAHGCASSAWTIGFFALHNWMLALFDERAQAEAFATRPLRWRRRVGGPPTATAFG